jgi:hypothetical protein
VSSGRHSFKKTDLVRALLAAKAAGFPVVRCEIDPKTGKITLVTKTVTDPAADDERNEWDE